jgi:hypothetical protein
MTNEIIRPCTLWGQTFDAIGASVLPSGRDMGVYTKDNRVIRFEFATREALEIGYMEAITTIAQGLNPPIKVSKLVLKAMEEVPEASFWYVEGSVNVRLKWDEILKTFTVKGQTLSITDYIQADCPLALQVLFQFNTEGKLLCLTK